MPSNKSAMITAEYRNGSIINLNTGFIFLTLHFFTINLSNNGNKIRTGNENAKYISNEL